MRNADEYRVETNGCGRGTLSTAVESGSCQRSYSICVGQIGKIDEMPPVIFWKLMEVTRICTQDAKAMHSSDRDPKDVSSICFLGKYNVKS